jgi:hypothetical protein
MEARAGWKPALPGVLGPELRLALRARGEIGGPGGGVGVHHEGFYGAEVRVWGKRRGVDGQCRAYGAPECFFVLYPGLTAGANC